MGNEHLWLAIGLTIFAGLSTGIGGLSVLMSKRINAKLLSVALGLSAGVMIYISFVELLSESREVLISNIGEITGEWINIAAFFGGILLIAIIDKLVPSYENPHETHNIEEYNKTNDLLGNKEILRVGVFTAFAIAIHNFPEGMATFISSVQQPHLGIAVAIAVAIHNIPEGISVAIPIYCATGS
jgi:ZIP family zinc transporter